MKQFKFKLQTVHNIRESRRDAAEGELGLAYAHVHAAQAQLEEVVRAQRVALTNYGLLYQSTEIEAVMVGAHSDFIASLVRRERDVRNRIVHLDREVELKRVLLTEALRDTKATAKLRERQQERHELDAARTEQTLMDEMAVAAIARRAVYI